VQQARSLACTLGERFEDIGAVFQAPGTRILRTAGRAPRMNAICERLVGTLRRELPDRVLILGEAHLRAVLTGCQAHCNTARPHQGIAQRVPDTDCGIQRERNQRRRTADPPKTRPRRLDQRICTRRLAH